MQVVVGLDIGSYSIKAVKIINTFNSYEIADFYETVIPDIENVSPDILLPACMEQLFKENKLEADRILTAIRGQYISSRIMSFNFADPRKIQGAVAAEIEDQVPFSLDDMIVDHQILGSFGGKTVTLAVMTRKIFMKNFLEHLQKVNIDPKLVDVDSLALYNLSSQIPVAADVCYALVDVGHEKTSVCIVQNGLLKMFRSINLGGRSLTEFLARDFELPFPEAQRLKHKVSRVLCSEDEGEDLDEESRMVAQRLTLATATIVKELGRTIYAFKNYEKSPITKVFVSGGTSRIRNFQKFLEDQLEVEVLPVRLENSGLKINSALVPHMEVMPQALAIGLRAVSAVKRHSTINLRRGEFAYVQDYEAILRWVGAASKVVAVALAVLLISYTFRSVLYHRHITALHEQFVKELTTTLPDAKKFATPNFAFNKIKLDAQSRFSTEVRKRREAVDAFVLQNSGSPAMQALQGISENVPKEVKVDLTLYQFGGTADGSGNIVLKGETDGYASVSSVIEALKRVQNLSEVQEKQSGPKPGTNNQVIEFTVQAVWGKGAASDKKKM
jgi:type IV pilus assembly protein PilM